MPALLKETDRLILRRFRLSDLEDLYAILSDPEAVAFEPYGPMSPEQVREALAWRISTGEMTAVELKTTGRMIGNVYLGKRDFDSLELGYLFRRDCWGQGYGTEACAALIGGAFADGIHRIYAECDPENGRSWRLLERLGFQREGHLRQNVYFRTDAAGKPLWKDTYLYAKLSERS